MGNIIFLNISSRAIANYGFHELFRF